MSIFRSGSLERYNLKNKGYYTGTQEDQGYYTGTQEDQQEGDDLTST